jgi:hypothetical protein
MSLELALPERKSQPLKSISHTVMSRTLFFIIFYIVGFAPAAELPKLDLFRDTEIVNIFNAIPAQESGQIMTLQNVAMERLAHFGARQSIWLTENGEMDGNPIVDPVTQMHIVGKDYKPVMLSATEWLLVSWFRPDIAKLVPLFDVNNTFVINELRLMVKAKEHPYAFAEIEPARETLMQKFGEYREIPTEKQTQEQQIIVKVAVNFIDYEMIIGHFDFIRSPLGSKTETWPAGITAPVRLSEHLNVLANAIRKTGGSPIQTQWFRELGKAALGAIMSSDVNLQLRIFPSEMKLTEVWYGPGEILVGAINGGKEVDAIQLDWLWAYEEIYLALPDEEKFKASCRALLAKIQDKQMPQQQGDFRNLLIWKIPDGWGENTTLAPMRTRLLDLRFGPNKEGECYISLMPGSADGIERYVNQWRWEMGKSAYTADEIAKLPQKPFFNRKSAFVAFDGDFKADTAKKGYRTLGIIHGTEQATIYVKLTGPKALVEQNAAAFDIFCQSIKTNIKK